MKALMLIIPVLLLVLGSCSKLGSSGNHIYSRYHNIGIKDDKDNFKATVNWGEKLIDLNAPLIDDKTKAIVAYKVRREVDDLIGFIPVKYSIKDVKGRGVILNPVLVYQTPTIHSPKKKQIVAPVLCFVLETKKNSEGEWAKILPYVPDERYQLSKNITTVDYEWVKNSDVSMANADVETIVSMQISIKNYKDAIAKFGKKSDSKEYKELVNSEITSLENIISTYKTSPAVGFAQDALELIAERGKFKKEEASSSSAQSSSVEGVPVDEGKSSSAN